MLAVVISPNSTTSLSGTTGTTIRIWDLQPTFGTLNCHREKLRREKIQGSIKTNIYSEKRHWRNSKAPKIASKAILNKEQ
ncbi:hypothetical protein [Trichormus azollae]|uniref:hypothetical protein n=1 Tax=Trichormus azollae TaxID=1164 RepID=UPI003B831BE2